MKKLFIVLMLLALASCGEPSVSHHLTKHKLGVTGSVELEIVQLEGCEYFFYQGTGYMLTHKGNCNNPIHKSKPE